MTQEFRDLCAEMEELRYAIATEHRISGRTRAVEYLDEALALVDAAYNVLRRENRWKKAPRDLSTVH